MKTKKKKFRNLESQTKNVVIDVASHELSNQEQPHSGFLVPAESKSLTYRTRFMKEPGVKAKEGKLAYVRKEYHERIQLIVQVIGGNDTSIYGFIDNVLTEHFALHKEEITELYHENYKRIF